MSRILSLSTPLMIQEDTNALSHLGKVNMLGVSKRILNFLVKRTQYYEMSVISKPRHNSVIIFAVV